MKLFCNGVDLLDAVLKVIKACAMKTTNPVLEGIKLKAEEETLSLCATDQELWIETKIPADVKIEGEIVVPGKFFNDFLRKLSGEQIEISVEKQLMKISYSDAESFIQCFSASDFPFAQKIVNSAFFEIERKNFREIISKTIFSVATDDTRPIYKGCCFEVADDKITSIALDGGRLALARKPVILSAAFSVIIPSRSLSEISKFLDDKQSPVKVFVQKNYVMMDIDNTRIISRRLEGDFININPILASNKINTKITVLKGQLEDAIDRASLLARHDKNNLVRMDVKSNLLTLTSSSNIGNIKENLTVSVEGKDISLSFNAKYISDCLKNIEEEYISLNLNSPSTHFTITSPSDKDEYLYLILPTIARSSN